jgi:hypothetical protein
MIPSSDWHCWEIMECDNPQDCLAWKHPEIPCWEIIRELNDYRNTFNVCQDCIVHILKTENSVLSEFQILKIWETKVECPMHM